MSKFIVYKSPKKKKWQLVFAWATIGLSVLYVVTLPSFERLFQGFPHIILPMFLLWRGIEQLIKLRREFFLEIDDTHVSWWLNEYATKQSILWSDVRWIRREKDGSFALFMASSFRQSFNPNVFTEHEQEQIFEQITVIAARRELPVVNFSAPVLEAV